MASPIAQPWTELFQGVAAQGQAFADDPLADDGVYYGFLSKVDLDDATTTYDVLFEVVNKAWMDNAVFSRQLSVPRTLPKAPALLYHLPAVPAAELLQVLGLKTTDDLAEGSWYQITLSKSQRQNLTAGDGALVGDLFDPDIDSIRS